MTYNSKNHTAFTALLLFAALTFMLLSGCSSTGSEKDANSYQVIIENQSETEVYEISYSRGGEAYEAGGGMFADGSPIKKGDDFSFTFREEPGTLNLVFHDKEKEVIAMSSGMAVGAGKSGCVCGAFNGGLLALGMFFGRTEQDGPTNPKSVKCMELVHELHDWFKKANGKNAICCRVLTKEFNMGQGEHKEQCIFFTGLCAWKVAQIVCRELGIKNLDEIDEPCERRSTGDGSI